MPHSSQPTDAARQQRDRRRLALFSILLATFALYAPSLANDFTWDDRFAAMGSGSSRQPLVATLHPLGDYFASTWWPQHEPQGQAYRPLTTLWFALRHAAVGDHALLAHLLNVLLHTLATGLAFVVIRRLGASFAGAALGALVFGLHAVHSEAVANLVGGAELLALSFGLSATLVLQGSMRTRGWHTAVALSGAAVLLFLAASSKESGLAWIVLSPLCALVPHWHAGTATASTPTSLLRRRTTLFAGISLVVAATYLSLRASALRLHPPSPEGVALLDNPLYDLPTAARAASALVAWGYGFVLSLLPFRLCVDHGPAQLPIVTSHTDPWLLASLAAAGLFAALAWFAVRHARRQPLPALAIACFFLFSAPVSNVAMPVFMHFADRSYTTPSLGLGLLVAWLVSRTKKGTTAAKVLTTMLAAWLLASVCTAWPRNFVFRDDATLILTEVENSPRSARLQLCAGVFLGNRGDTKAAQLHFERAAELAPELPQPWLELAELALRKHQFAEAAAALAHARAANPREVARYRARIDTAQSKLLGAGSASPR
ncbi:MAG: hypothetical protein IT456_00535 [Planctomycetes bacterium]|nr:hypothetical protein [Planctomycetota bacterium]